VESRNPPRKSPGKAIVIAPIDARKARVWGWVEGRGCEDVVRWWNGVRVPVRGQTHSFPLLLLSVFARKERFPVLAVEGSWGDMKNADCEAAPEEGVGGEVSELATDPGEVAKRRCVEERKENKLHVGREAGQGGAVEGPGGLVDLVDQAKRDRVAEEPYKLIQLLEDGGSRIQGMVNADKVSHRNLEGEDLRRVPEGGMNKEEVLHRDALEGDDAAGARGLWVRVLKEILRVTPPLRRHHKL